MRCVPTCVPSCVPTCAQTCAGTSLKDPRYCDVLKFFKKNLKKFVKTFDTLPCVCYYCEAGYEDFAYLTAKELV